ncbi:proline--tRNA ligase [Patescibacteria group bacterium]|nr:proline--tRNA ligase [Patescibacteria group bacterium]
MIGKKKVITKKSEDFSRWYTDVVQQAELADYAPVKGCIIFRPYGYALWEGIKKALDAKIKAMGVENAYFPLFIPQEFLQKEKEHVEGFAPELAVVTHGGGKKLEEPLIVRPTSETVMYAMFSKWIQSWRDLPLKINQWCNVVRWEKRTLPFIRTTEFLWQEGHTAHAEHKEALDQVHAAAQAYEEIFKDYLAIYGITGFKSNSEKFAGAAASLSYEALMPDGKALQSSTSHDLGQNFAKAFEITFQDQKGKNQYVWQTSWGLSTRAVGGLIMVHGDDNGLFFPPQIAPIQIIIVPIYGGDEEGGLVKQYVSELKSKLIEFRVKVDSREEYSPGWKFNEWELKGVPLRLEIGPREVKSQTVMAIRRDTGDKTSITTSELTEKVTMLLKTQQKDALERSRKFTEENTHLVDTYDQFKEIMSGPRGFIKAFWCENPGCEAKIKEETKATTRCLPLDAVEEKGKCVYCDEPATHRWLFAQAY